MAVALDLRAAAAASRRHRIEIRIEWPPGGALSQCRADANGLVQWRKNPHHPEQRPGVPRQSRLRSHPLNLSGSYQRREPPLDGQLLIYLQSRRSPSSAPASIGLGIAWRLASRGASVDGVRPWRGGSGCKPRRSRDARRLRRGRARRGGAGRARARQPGALAGVCGGSCGEPRASTWNCARKARWSIALDGRRSGTAASPPGVSAQARPAAAVDFRRGNPQARAASCRQARRRSLESRRSSGRQPQARHRLRTWQRKLQVRSSASTPRSGKFRPPVRALTESSSPTERKFAADVVVLAAGAWSRSIGGLAPELRPPVRPIKGQMLALRMDPSSPLLEARIVGAWRLHGAAPRWPPDLWRDRRGKGLRHHPDRRRPPDAARSRMAGHPGDRGTADRGDVGRPSPRQPRRRPDPRTRPRSMGWSTRPATIATASCSRR